MNRRPEHEEANLRQLREELRRGNPWWRAEASRPDLVPRTALGRLVDVMFQPRVPVVRGMRRTGKTTLLRQLVSHLLARCRLAPSEVLYVDFEWPAVRQLSEGVSRIEGVFAAYVAEMAPTRRPLLLFDEIQTVPEWPHWVRQAQEQERAWCVVSGSSELLVDPTLRSVMTGRTWELELWPFSLHEYGLLLERTQRRTFERDAPAPYLRKLTEDWLASGGLPGYAWQLTEQEARGDPYARHEHDAALRLLFGQLLHDVAVRQRLRNLGSLTAVAEYLLAQTGRLISDSAVKNRLQVGGDQVRSWREGLQQAFVLHTMDLDTNNVARRVRNPRKIHASDTGLRNAVTPRHTRDLGHLAETAVHNALRRRPGRALTYYRDQETQSECDFVARVAGGAEEVLQVTFGAEDAMPARELPGLIAAARSLKADAATVVTGGADWRRVVDGVEVRALPLWAWLFEEADREDGRGAW